MRFISLRGGVFIGFALASQVSMADAILRVICENDEGAKIYINGEYKGDCPVDLVVKPGNVTLRAHKMADADHEQIFEQQIQMADGVAKRMEIVLPAPVLTEDAKIRNFNAALVMAQAGDIKAMADVSNMYSQGIGVKVDPQAAEMWRTKKTDVEAAEKAQKAAAEKAAKIKQEYSAAMAGDIPSMWALTKRYETGDGVKQDAAQADAWRNKAKQAQAEKDAQLARENEATRRAAAQKSVDEFSFVWVTKTMFWGGVVGKETDDNGNPTKWDNEKHTPGLSTTALTSLPLYLFVDLTSLPTRISKYMELKKQLAYLPASWAKPDSMIAKAAQVQYMANANIAE